MAASPSPPATSLSSIFRSTSTPTPTSCSNLIPTFLSSPSSSSTFRLNFSHLRLAGGARSGSRVPAVVARFGGGRTYRPRPRPSGGGGRGRRNQGNTVDPNYDAALDLDRIRSSTVRLLDQEQNMIGVVSIDDAIQMADDSELILAILSPDADPPVLRLFDVEEFKKHKYEQQKKKRVQQKRSLASRVDIKEIKMRYRIESHDYTVRVKAAKKFLKDGDKVKVIVEMKKARETEFRNLAIELIKRFQNDVGELATEESKNFSERNIFIVLAPNKAVIQKTQELEKRKEAVTGELEKKKEAVAGEMPANV